MTIEPIYLLIALLPLIAYLLLLGVIRISGRVLVTTGGRDIAALGFSVAGWVAIGPGELFFPKAAAGVFGGWVWLALATFYGLIVSLLALTARPRLVVYGRTPEQMLTPLLEAALELDSEASCDRETLQVYLPNLRVHLRASGHQAIDTTSIESFEPIAAAAFWGKLLGHLRDKAAATTAPAPRRGGTMIAVALAIGTLVVWRAVAERQQVVEGFREWLWR
ncbi:hypothetical protein Mal15_17390 [Stieleria maiorica]|uniref:Uncharacterized protein n=1 Tax=Stieleria maiorica TaxID=2795974 RepID=A0A5B9MES7_9BACT|nr:hypothetical protein [Stieleria maiorica]QEF97697.1 hypothetical protein Mal15_17390 [Stieleria maiorica]